MRGEEPPSNGDWLTRHLALRYEPCCQTPLACWCGKVERPN
jgi:hypothetical protein